MLNIHRVLSEKSDTEERKRAVSCTVGSKPEFDSVIVRFGGEIGIKGAWTRRAYERRLMRNIRSALKRYDVPYDEIVRKRGRIFVRTESAVEVATRLAKVFGISSVSPAFETNSRLGDIVDKSLFLAGFRLGEEDSFAVRCRRVGDHPYSSYDVCREVGRRVLDEFSSLGVKVNLDSPDVRLAVEVRNDLAFIFSEIVDCAGGFPLGTQPRVFGLLSGGIDSAVACWLVMKRGCPLTPVYFDNAPYTDETTTERTLEVAKVLFDWAIGFTKRLYVVRHGDNLEEIVEKCPSRFTCIICKRMMYRVAERLAELKRTEGIVTGEAIGEQASQTLRNLRVLNAAVSKYPIHRPLLGFNKAETERIARKIGTYKASTRKAKGCGAVPKKPATMAKLEKVEKAEEKLDIEEMAETSVKSLKAVKIDYTT